MKPDLVCKETMVQPQWRSDYEKLVDSDQIASMRKSQKEKS